MNQFFSCYNALERSQRHFLKGVVLGNFKNRAQNWANQKWHFLRHFGLCMFIFKTSYLWNGRS